ncbi:MAG: hypothetical protein AAGH68_07575 [Pseudomonadota bacterium]
MKPFAAAALAAVVLTSACVLRPEGPPFPPGAQSHGPYLDRSFEGYVVRAAYVADISVITVQDASSAPETTVEQYAEARVALTDGTVVGAGEPFGLGPLPPITLEATRFEETALRAAETPGWCPFGTRFSYLEAVETPIEHPFKIRGSFHGGVDAFVFAGQCRPTG